jgi:hypothetical protein
VNTDNNGDIGDEQLGRRKGWKQQKLKKPSISFASPEALKRSRKSKLEPDAVIWKAGDIYSFSMLLYSIVNLYFPFDNGSFKWDSEDNM